MSDDLPVPVPDEDDAEWWAQLQQGRLTVVACDACGARWSRPLPSCPYCGSDTVALVDTTGQGSVYSWVTVRRALDPAFEGTEPYTVLVVDLDDGGRVNGRLLDDDPVDQYTRVQFVPYRQAGWNLIGFKRTFPGIEEEQRAVR
jgi:uncharacterized OB-fold protein